MSKEIKDIANWFAENKAADLKPKIDDGLKLIESGEPLSENQRKLFGFMLFSYSMNHGPVSFLLVEELAKKHCVMEEFKNYAGDWINHSNKTKTT